MVTYQASRNLSQGNRIYNGAILTRPIGLPQAEPFVLAKEGFLPKWSPDGKQVAFAREERDSLTLKTINVEGGEEKALVTDGLRLNTYTVLPYTRREAKDFSWSPDGRRLAYSSIRDGLNNLRVILADGSSDTPITDNGDANLLVFCPLWSADGKRLAYMTRPIRIATPQENIVNFCVSDVESGAAKVLARMNTVNRLLGWLTDQDLLFARYHVEEQMTSLWRVSPAGEQSRITDLPPANLPTNFYNIHLSPNRRAVAYVAHLDGKDNVWMIPAGGGAPTRLTVNNDPQQYFSTLAWSPDSRAIYYGKQSRFSLLSMINNFK